MKIFFGESRNLSHIDGIIREVEYHQSRAIALELSTLSVTGDVDCTYQLKKHRSGTVMRDGLKGLLIEENKETSDSANTTNW